VNKLQFSKFSFIVLKETYVRIQHVEHNQLQEVAVPPADDRDTGGYPFSKYCDKYWLTIELFVRADGQNFMGLLP
jgi:hypothetical protein